MKISNQNYNPNFGSKKLADLLLRKNGKACIPAELHTLLPEDAQMINNLGQSLDWCKTNEGLCSNMCVQFIENLSTEFKNQYFFIIKQKDKVIAMCEARLKNKELKIDFISNINRDKDVKGAGTSLIVQLVEVAKKLGDNCEAVNLSSLEKAFAFYDKLNFQRIETTTHYIMNRDYFNKFLAEFKPKYFSK